MSVLLVDGDNLLTIGFYGLKNHFYKGRHIGAIFHFLNTLRRAFENYNLEKIVVFWDGENASFSRRKIYANYKLNRHKREKTEEEIDSYNYQRNRVKQYLEEVYVRQGEYEYCETDDCIAFYCLNSDNEKKIIYSSDGDLTQFISDSIQVYNPSKLRLLNKGEQINYKTEDILIDNLILAKMICGDPSDNFYGIRSLGIKSLIQLFPEIKTEKLTLEQIIDKGNLLFEKDKTNKKLSNLLTGVTKEGVFGDEYFQIAKKLIDLNNPILTKEAEDEIKLLINEKLDSDGRSYKNTIKMMMEDGLFNVLPKSDDAWINFLNPFLRLTRKEKNKKTIKIKNYE